MMALKGKLLSLEGINRRDLVTFVVSRTFTFLTKGASEEIHPPERHSREFSGYEFQFLLDSSNP